MGNESNTIQIEYVTEKSQNPSGFMMRCPITGAYCSHRNKIKRRKAKRHKDNKVMIFMIMHYSPITDTIYKWLLKDVIKDQDIRFEFIDPVAGEAVKPKPEKRNSIEESGPMPDGFPYETEYYDDSQEKMFTLEDGCIISLVRADDFSSNSHIVCESVCAKIQEADMVIVDLSYGNPNVFYEFGMAVALGKKILPICYIDKYYDEKESNIKNFIRGFEWKEFLMKYFSVNRVESLDDIKYYEKGDAELSASPYDKVLRSSGEPVGTALCNLLNKTLANLDTLMVYNLTGFEKSNMCQCIKNYETIIKKVCEGMKSPGDRVCLMYSHERLEFIDQENAGNDNMKYSFGDICRLAINQGIYDIEAGAETIHSYDKAERLVKNYIYNRTLKMKLQYPVFVDNIVERIFYGLKELYGDCEEKDRTHFSYLDIMLANAANCNIAFLDFRTSSLQALFWLGLFHGSGRFAVPLRYEKSRMKDEEKQLPVDVAGFWNAYYFNENSTEFKRCIRMVLENIYEKRGHLKYFEKRAFLSKIRNDSSDCKEIGHLKVYDKYRDQFETFYKRKFWEAMLAEGDVEIYPTPISLEQAKHISNWEYDGISFILDYVGDLNFIHSVEFKNVFLPNKKNEEKKKEKEAIGSKSIKSCISMGDRDVNLVSASLLEPYEPYLYMLKKCDRCRKNGKEYTACFNNKDGRKECSISEKMNKASEVKNAKSTAEGLKRGFYFGEEEHVSIFSTAEQLREQGNSEKFYLELYGHFVISRETQKNIYQVILEGCSGPGTLGLAKVLSVGDIEKECYFFEHIQRKLLKYYGSELKKRLSGMGEYSECIVHYMCCSLCNCFLPVITKEYLQALKKRAWGFVHNPGFIQEETPQLRDSQVKLLWEIIDKWIEWIDKYRCLEAIVKVEVESSFFVDHQQDLRGLKKITLLPESVRLVLDGQEGLHAVRLCD